LIDLLVAGLLLGALLHLVLVRACSSRARRDPARSRLLLAAATAATTAALHLHLILLLLGNLRQRQRALLGRQRRISLRRAQLALGGSFSAAAFGISSAIDQRRITASSRLFNWPLRDPPARGDAPVEANRRLVEKSSLTSSALSRLMLNVAATICRCCRSCPTVAPRRRHHHHRRRPPSTAPRGPVLLNGALTK
jgi:hypothetical protein